MGFFFVPLLVTSVMILFKFDSYGIRGSWLPKLRDNFDKPAKKAAWSISTTTHLHFSE